MKKCRIPQSFYDIKESYTDRASRVALCMREALENTLAWRLGDRSVVRAISAHHPLLGNDIIYLVVAMQNKPFESMDELLSKGLLPLQSGDGANALRGCGLVVSAFCSSPDRKAHLFVASKIDGRLRVGRGYAKDSDWVVEECPVAAKIIEEWCGPDTLRDFPVVYVFPFPKDENK